MNLKNYGNHILLYKKTEDNASSRADSAVFSSSQMPAIILEGAVKEGASTVHTWFEMVTCNIDTLNVKRFPVRESHPAQNILSETNYAYDASFWDDFNIILPEERLSEAILRMTSKIEESVEKFQ